MAGGQTQASWVERFPGLADLAGPEWEALLRATRIVEVPKGTVVFHHGDPCRYYMLVLEGSVRVQKVAENGREITLYRVEGGQSCVLTTSCLLADETYPAEGVAETDVRAVAIPHEQFHAVLSGSPAFRRFIFAAYGRRISSLIVLVEEIAFGRLETRLAQCLLGKAAGGSGLETTHQALASELGTAREVISRQLKEFERRGWIRLGRGRIELLDTPALQSIADD